MTLTCCACNSTKDVQLVTREGKPYCAICRDMMPKSPTHYIAMSGMHGCLPDACNAYETYQAAVDELAGMFELGRTRKARLFADHYLELSTKHATGTFDDGAEYCEITACQCAKPWEHCDAGDDPRDWPEYEQHDAE